MNKHKHEIHCVSLGWIISRSICQCFSIRKYVRWLFSFVFFFVYFPFTKRGPGALSTLWYNLYSIRNPNNGDWRSFKYSRINCFSFYSNSFHRDGIMVVKNVRFCSPRSWRPMSCQGGFKATRGMSLPTFQLQMCLANSFLSGSDLLPWQPACFTFRWIWLLALCLLQSCSRFKVHQIQRLPTFNQNIIFWLSRETLKI